MYHWSIFPTSTWNLRCRTPKARSISLRADSRQTAYRHALLPTGSCKVLTNLSRCHQQESKDNWKPYCHQLFTQIQCLVQSFRPEMTSTSSSGSRCWCHLRIQANRRNDAKTTSCGRPSLPRQWLACPTFPCLIPAMPQDSFSSQHLYNLAILPFQQCHDKPHARQKVSKHHFESSISHRCSVTCHLLSQLYKTLSCFAAPNSCSFGSNQ